MVKLLVKLALAAFLASERPWTFDWTVETFGAPAVEVAP
jgi:hypothetical protein